MNTLQDNFESYIATVAAMLTSEGMEESATLLRTAKLRLEETGFDNRNGGTTIWTIYLLMSAGAYARLAPRRAALEVDDRQEPSLGRKTTRPQH